MTEPDISINQPRLFKPSRNAKIWKTTGEMAGGEHADINKLSMEEQLKVRMALKIMRKAYTKGSRFSRERQKLQKRADVDGELHKLRKKVKKERGIVDDEDQGRFFMETEPIRVKTMDEIIKEAKVSFHHSREIVKFEQQSKKFGQLRPISVALIQEIKDEMLKAIEEKKASKLLLAQQVEQQQQPQPGRVLENQLPQLQPPPERPRTTIQQLLPQQQQSQQLFIAGRISRPQSAQMIREHRSKTSIGGELPLTRQSRPSSSGGYRSRAPTLMRMAVSSFERENEEDDDEDEDGGDDQLGDLNTPLQRTDDAPSQFRRVSSVSFVSKSVLDDEKIMKAKRNKEKQENEKEEQLRRKIIERERNTILKQEMVVLQERQRHWLIIQSALAYLSVFYVKIDELRQRRCWLKQQTKDKRAAALIQKWWMSKRIWLIVRRYPSLWQRMVRALLRYRLRLRHYRKQQAAFLLLLLWLAAEKIGRRIAKQQRLAKLKNEAMKEVSGFAETVSEIDVVKKRIGKVLEYQTEASKKRDEINLQIKALQLDMVQPNGVADGTAYAATGRRKPVLIAQPSVAQLMVSTNSQQDLFEETDGPTTSSYITPNRMQAYMNAGGGNSFYFNSSGGTTNLDASSGAMKNRSHAKLVRKQSTSSLGMDSSADPRYLGNSSSSVNLLGQSGQSNTPKMTKRNSYKKANSKLGLRTTGYNLLTLGVLDRYGSQDSDLGLWLKKVRSTPMNMKLYESLRNVLQQQRRKYVKRLNTIRYQRRMNPVNVNDLVAFLRDPRDYSKSHQLSEAMNTRINGSAIPDTISDMRQCPFLLLTGGGLEAIETLLSTNKYRFCTLLPAGLVHEWVGSKWPDLEI
eukprot:scaffold297_cov164-Ochromonas_danica.AAC.2